MPVKTRRSAFGFIGSLSLGIVILLSQIWLYSQADVLFPENPEIWQVRIGIYLLITIVIFGWDAVGRRTEKELFNITFFKAIPKMLIALAITYGILFVLGTFVLGNQVHLIGNLAAVGIGLIFFHVFIVSINEELIFRGAVPEALKKAGASITAILITTSIVFALFHYATAGGEILLLPLYFALGIIFYKVKQKYSDKTNMANAGVHAGWNLGIITNLLGAG